MEITTLNSFDADVNSRENDLLVYPNPSNSIITVEGDDIKEIILFTIDGKEVLRNAATAKNTQVDISELTDGLYILKAEGDEENYFKKIIKSN